MSAKKQIEAIRRDLIELFGMDDAIIKAVELKVRYYEIGREFHMVRKFSSYEKSLEYVCNEFYVSKSTAKRAIATFEAMVHDNGLTKDKTKT